MFAAAVIISLDKIKYGFGGSADGIITLYEHSAEYQALLWDVNQFVAENPVRDNLLVLSGENDKTLVRFQDYYSVNPDKIRGDFKINVYKNQ